MVGNQVAELMALHQMGSRSTSILRAIFLAHGRTPDETKTTSRSKVCLPLYLYQRLAVNDTQSRKLTQMVHALTCDLSISQGDLGAFITEQLARSMNFSFIGILFSVFEALHRVPAVI